MQWPSVARLAGGLLDYNHVTTCGVTVSIKANGTNVGIGHDGTLYGRRWAMQSTETYQKVPLDSVKAVKINDIGAILKKTFGVDKFIVYGEFIVRDLPKNDGFKKGEFYVFGIVCVGTPKAVPGFNVIWSPQREGTFIIGMNPRLETTLNGLCTCVPSTDYVNLEVAFYAHSDVFETNEGLVITFKVGQRTRTEITNGLPPSNKFFQCFKHTRAGIPKDLKILRNLKPRTSLIEGVIGALTPESDEMGRSVWTEVTSAETKYDTDVDINTIIKEVGEARAEESRCVIE